MLSVTLDIVLFGNGAVLPLPLFAAKMLFDVTLVFIISPTQLTHYKEFLKQTVDMQDVCNSSINVIKNKYNFHFLQLSWELPKTFICYFYFIWAVVLLPKGMLNFNCQCNTLYTFGWQLRIFKVTLQRMSFFLLNRNQLQQRHCSRDHLPPQQLPEWHSADGQSSGMGERVRQLLIKLHFFPCSCCSLQRIYSM